MKKGLLAKGALCLAFAAALTGCGSQGIGPNASDPSLKGETTITQVFNGGGAGPATQLDAAALKTGQSYSATGQLTIKGNVPDDVSITVDNGKLVVQGSLGNKDRIEVNEPVKTHTEMSSGYCYGYDFMSGKFEYSYKFTPSCENTVTDGLRYKDAGPAVNVSGGIGTDVRINTNGPIVVGGATLQNPNQMRPAP